MAVLSVGAGKQFSTIASAVAASHDGDTIDVQAGTYTNDFVNITDSITLEAVGGRVLMNATENAPNGKAIVTEGSAGNSVTITGFDFQNATNADGNGAGIRYEGGNLTINDDSFENNQNGIMGNPMVTGTGTLTIENSQFIGNGSGSGNTHDLYAGYMAQLTVKDSYFGGANVGHQIKSRALNTTITNNRIIDNSSTTSYEIDIPQGGNTTITGNVIQQGANSQNPIIISYAEEGPLYGFLPGNQLTVSGNTIVNDLSSPSAMAVVNAGSGTATVSGNSVYGLTSDQITRGAANVSGTSFLTAQPVLDTSAPWSDPPTGTNSGGTTGTSTSTDNGTGPSSGGTQGQTAGGDPSSSGGTQTPPSDPPKPAPVLTTPANPGTVAPNGTIHLTGISFSDPWAAAQPGGLLMKLSTSAGLLSTGVSTGSQIFLGVTYATLESDLANLTYKAGATPGTAKLTLSVMDQAGISVSKTIDVTIAAQGTGSTGTGSTGGGSSPSGSTGSGSPPIPTHDTYIAPSRPSGISFEVQQLYEGLLNRPADASGLAFWTGELQSGMSMAEVANGFATSTELATIDPGSADPTNFVNTIYESALGRGPDADGLAFWSSAISYGIFTRGQVAAAVALSPEALRDSGTVDTLFIATLDRAPTDAEAAQYGHELATGQQTLAQEAASLMATPEFKAEYGGATPSAAQLTNDLYLRATGTAPTPTAAGQLTALITSQGAAQGIASFVQQHAAT